MKRNHFRKYLLVTIVLIGLALIMPSILYTQEPKAPPPPPYMPEDLPPVELPPDQQPTSTPDPIEAERLPMETPPIIPTFEVIDTAPEIPHNHKYHLVIKRGKSGKQVLIAVPLGTDKEAVLKTYLNPDEGDEFVRTSPPPMIRPTPPLNQ